MQAFKTFFMEKSKLAGGTDPSEFLNELLETCRTNPRAEIEVAVIRALDFLDSASMSS
jgi:hypothetical protein